MTCCGRLRATLPGDAATIDTGPVWYRYSGTRVLVVHGPATGRSYRFAPGTALRVNALDARSFGGIPGLRRQGGEAAL
jgi:hypothetical protein